LPGGAGHREDLVSSVPVHDVKVDVAGQKLVTIKIPPPVNSRASRAAEIVGMPGFDGKKVECLLVVVEPIAIALLFEQVSIVAFGFSFGAYSGGQAIPVPEYACAMTDAGRGETPLSAFFCRI
jgi:hypothetical protein